LTSNKNTFVKKLDKQQSRSVPKISIDDYLANAPDSKCDLIDGHYLHHSPASQNHVKLRQFLVPVINSYVIKHNLGLVLSENFPVKLDEQNWREPDIVFIPNSQLEFLYDTIFIGTPAFIIEIISEDSKLRDKIRKRAEYEEIGVKEYWILDPLSRENSLFLKLKTKKYEHIQFIGNKLEVTSIPGLFFLTEWIWPDKDYPWLPNVFQALNLLVSSKK